MTKFLTIAVFLGVTISTGASAATCANREHVVSQLEARFSEVLLANSVNASNQILEVYGSRENDTWSILVYLPDRNLSCLAATGEGLEQLSAELHLQF